MDYEQDYQTNHGEYIPTHTEKQDCIICKIKTYISNYTSHDCDNTLQPPPQYMHACMCTCFYYHKHKSNRPILRLVKIRLIVIYNTGFALNTFVRVHKLNAKDIF